MKMFRGDALLLYVAHEAFIKVPLFQEIFSALRNSWLCAFFFSS